MLVIVHVEKSSDYSRVKYFERGSPVMIVPVRRKRACDAAAKKLNASAGKCFAVATLFPRNPSRDKQEMLLRRSVVPDFVAHLFQKHRRNRIVSRLVYFLLFLSLVFFHFARYITGLQF